MSAWLDRPAERDRDLQDIAHVFNEYLEPDAPRRWEDELIEAQRAYEDQSAFALGRDIGAIAREIHYQVINGFLATVGDESAAAHAGFARHLAHENSSAILDARLQAFRRGLFRWSQRSLAPPFAANQS
jgi:predicted nucleotidyltransferase